MTDQNNENGLNDVFVETAYSPSQIMRAIEAEERLGIRESPCAFSYGGNSENDTYAVTPRLLLDAMDIFFDTEFTDMVGAFHEPALISIGLISGDGKEFYAELTDTWEKKACSEFVIKSVLPSLQGGDCAMSEADCAARLKIWIEGFQKQVRLYSDAPSYDWPWVEKLFDKYGWPENLARKCNHACIFESDTERFRYNNATADFWRTSNNTGASMHHALWDARCIRFARRYATRKR